MNCVDRLSIIALPASPSTNSHAKNQLQALQAQLPCFLLAESQSAGRGRDRRVWDSPPGGFYGSLIWALPENPPLSYGLLSLLAGLGVRDLLTELLPGHHFDLKWPNDILYAGRKIAGILVENQIKGTQWLSIWGSGINLDRRHSPFSGELSRSAISASDLGNAELFPISLAPRLFEHYCRWLSLWSSGQILPIMKGLEEASSSFRLRPISIHDRGEVCCGMFEKIDEQGALWLKMENGETRICYTGEIREESRN